MIIYAINRVRIDFNVKRVVGIKKKSIFKLDLVN